MSDQNSISDFLNELNGSEGDINEAISEGMSNLKSKISGMDIQVEAKGYQEGGEVKSPIPETKAKNAASLADRAINTYKTKIKPATGVEAGKVEVSQPSTKASRESMKAAVRAITGGRSSGNVGKPSPTLPSGAGNVGTNDMPPVGLLATSMTIEEYKDHIWGSFGLLDEAEVSGGEVIEHSFAEELDLVSILEDALLEGDTRDWMEVDYLARQVCLEHGVSLKELNKAFKDIHGQYPDKWIKEQVEITMCGWMPLDEATRVNKIGLVYEVSFMHRGHVNRYKFFWPNMTRPSKEEMQKTIEGFYPKAKVLAFYPAAKQDDNFMVIVPPMSENFEVYRYDEWMELTEEENESFHTIAEEVGEPTGLIIINEDGNYSVVVESHDTGEHIEVEFFTEGAVSGIETSRKIRKDFRDKKYNAPKVPKKKEESKDKISSFSLERPIDGGENWLSKEEFIPEGDEMKGLTQKGGHKRSTDSGAGLTQKGVDAVNRKTGGNLKTAVTTPPSKLKPGSKAAGRRKSFCARSRGWDGERGKAARRRWNC